MNDIIEKIARAVLYEGYLLYPYRSSALKNRQRWNFGVLFPEDIGSVKAGAERSFIQTECIILGTGATTLRVSVRFLHLIGTRLSSTRPAVEREVCTDAISLGRLCGEAVSHGFRLRPEAELATSQKTIEGRLDVTATQISENVFKATAVARNVTLMASEDSDRDTALMHSLISTHLVLYLADGEFVSLMDPAVEQREAANTCQNLGLWPVLVGNEGQHDCMLAAPIILYDYPQVAPESPGDLFDGTEIDELLTLRVLTLTEEEKNEMRNGDARAREILERSETMSTDHLLKLHGALRGLRHGK